MKSNFLRFVFYTIFSHQRKISFFIVSICAAAFSSAFFLFSTNFFSGFGTTDVRVFFETLLPIFLILPVLIALETPNDFSRFPLTHNERVLLFACSVFFRFLLATLPLLLIPVFLSRLGDVDFFQLSVAYFFTLCAGFSLAAIFSFFFFAFPKVLAFFLSLTISVSFVFFHETKISRFHFYSNMQNAFLGIFDLGNFLFFCFVSILFLLLAAIIDKKKIGGKEFGFEKKRFFIFLFISFFLFFFFQKKSLQFGIKILLLPETTKENLKIFDDFSVTYYRTPAVEKKYPKTKNVEAELLRFSRKEKNVHVKIKNPDSDAVKRLLFAYGIQGIEIQNEKEKKSLPIKNFSSLVFEAGGKTFVVPLVLDDAHLDYELAKAIHFLSRKNLPRVFFISSFSFPVHFSIATEYLRIQGIPALEISSDDFLKNDFSKADVLVFSGTENFFPSEITKIKTELNAGTNFIFAANPFEVAVTKNWELSSAKNNLLFGFLKSCGILFENAILLDEKSALLTFTSKSADPETLLYPLWVFLQNKTNAKNPAFLFWGSPVTLSNEKAFSILETSATGFRLYENIETNPFFWNENFSQIAEKKFKQKETAGCFLPGEAGSGNLFVVGSSLFFTDEANTFLPNSNANYEVLTNFILRSCGENELADLQNKKVLNTNFYKAKKNFQTEAKKLVLKIFVFEFSFCFFAFFINSVLHAIFLFQIKRRMTVFEK